MIQKDIDVLEREKSNSIKKYNILKILENIGAIFTGAYAHYKEVPKKTIVKRNILKAVKLRRRRIAEIEKEEQDMNNNLFKEYFTNYQNPSGTYKKLRKAEGEWNEDQVYLIKKMLNKMKKNIKKVPEEKEKIINIVEHILYFNQLNQSGQVLKILTPNQMLSRLPISVAQLKAGNNSVKLKNEIRQVLSSLYRSKKTYKATL